MVVACERWLGFRMGVVNCLFIFAVALAAIYVSQDAGKRESYKLASFSDTLFDRHVGLMRDELKQCLRRNETVNV